MEIISDIINYVSNWQTLIAKYFVLFKFEAKLAKLSLFRLIIILLIIFSFAAILWINVLVIIGYSLFTYFHGIWLALIVPLILNIGGIIACTAYGVILSRRLTFPQLKKSLTQFKLKQAQHEHTPIKKTN